ncbi:MAG: hypothetical protein NVS4B12_04170 [Ktedonobacteraceae bacterium]
MNRTYGVFAFLGLVVAFLLTACGSSGSGTTTTSTTSATPTSITTMAHATLAHVPSGTADISWDPATKAVTVKILLAGLAPKSVHPSHIHTGSCINQGGVLHSLQNIVANAMGNATATTIIPNISSGIPASGWYVNVHNGPGLTTTDQFLPIVCGDVANTNTSPSAMQTVHVMLDAAPGASGGQAAMGKATLMLSGSTLTVSLTLSGLVPNSKHAAHIHMGSCTSQGNVLYPLPTVVADASGNAMVSTTINNVTAIPASGWYVNVHNSTALATQTGFDPIACGNVTLG